MGIDPEKLKLLDELASRRLETTIHFGERRKVIVFDVICRTNNDIWACLDNGEVRLYTIGGFDNETTKNRRMVVDIVRNGRNAIVDCIVFGNRILRVFNIEDYNGELPYNVYGIVERTTTSNYVWITTIDGERLLVLDQSIKGMLACGMLKPNDKIIAFARITDSPRGIRMITHLHWIYMPEQEKETQHEVESERVESEKVEGEVIQQVESIGSGKPETFEAATVEPVKRVDITDVEVCIHTALPSVLARKVGDIDKHVECLETDNLVDAILCMFRKVGEKEEYLDVVKKLVEQWCIK